MHNTSPIVNIFYRRKDKFFFSTLRLIVIDDCKLCFRSSLYFNFKSVDILEDLFSLFNLKVVVSNFRMKNLKNLQRNDEESCELILIAFESFIIKSA